MRDRTEARGPAALLVTDVRMPGEDGLALLRELRERGDVPVIVMSAYTDVATTAAAYRAGAVDYLAKPFDLDQAVEAVGRACWPTRPSTKPPPNRRRPTPCWAKAPPCARCSA